jgi:hypothetical protein
MAVFFSTLQQPSRRGQPNVHPAAGRATAPGGAATGSGGGPRAGAAVAAGTVAGP